MNRLKDASSLCLRHSTRSKQVTWYSIVPVDFVASNISVGIV